MIDGRKRALVLAGGGARGAYHVGMLLELVKQYDFGIIRGVSAGALNSAFLAQASVAGDSRANLAAAVDQLADVWRNEITSNDAVYREVPFGPASTLVWADSLFTIEPARTLIRRHIDVTTLIDAQRDFQVGTVSLCSGEFAMHAPTAPNFMEKLIGSMSLPPAFPPVDLGPAEQDMLIDGGMRNITPLASAFAAGPDEIFVLLTSKVDPKPGGIAESSIEAMDYSQWQDNAIGTKIKLQDVFGRAYSILMDEVYLEDIKQAIHWNEAAAAIDEIEKLVDARVGEDGDLAASLRAHLDRFKALKRAHVPIHVLAPTERFNPYPSRKGDADLCTNFDSGLIHAAIEHGREIARDPRKWLWPRPAP